MDRYITTAVTLLTMVAGLERACPPPGPVAPSPRTAYSQPDAPTQLRNGTTIGVPVSWLDGVPRIDAGMKARLQEIHRRGLARGMRPAVFAKLGDSMTESASFLQDIGRGWYDLGSYTTLRETIEYFHRTAIDEQGNDSFAHPSSAAVAGWTVDDALQGAPSHPVAHELDTIRPATALVMFGTNDIDRSTPDQFATSLRLLVDECIARGVIPVLSTIPDRLDSTVAAERVPTFNARIVDVARQRKLPWMNLHAVLSRLPRHGLNSDGIHLSVYTNSEGQAYAAVFTPEALRYGYNVRNLVALQTLHRLRSIVFEDGAPDP